MGSFKIEIEAVGGHGDDRKAEAGDHLDLAKGNTPDSIAYEFVAMLRDKGFFQNGGSATLTHWPGTKTEVVDDLIACRRLHGSFSNPKEDEDGILQFFVFDHLPPHLSAISKPFAEAARRLVRTLPRNAERTVALRKLLEAKDAAVRALITK